MFKINIHCIVFGANEALNKKCILSITENDIKPPLMTLDNVDQINTQVITFLKEFIFVNDLVLIPQIITIHSSVLNTDPNTLDIVYGFVVDYNSSINNSKAYWLDFDLMNEHKLSPILFETIQKL